MSRWHRVEQIGDDTILDTEVQIVPTSAGKVVLDVAVVERFLTEAGYERVPDPTS